MDICLLGAHIFPLDAQGIEPQVGESYISQGVIIRGGSLVGLFLVGYLHETECSHHEECRLEVRVGQLLDGVIAKEFFAIIFITEIGLEEV